MPDEAIVAVTILGVAVWWVVLIWSVSWWTGWRTLAHHYHLAGPFHGHTHRFQHVSLGWSNYGGCVTVGSNADGLYLAVMLPFRPGHRPLFIPWVEIKSAEFVRKWYGSWLEFRTAAAPWVRLRLTERLGKRVAADANRAWSAA
ncbi:hypothetical protein [Urbifossiella limnaea]|uniref:Uncharacterized protein n=1 Tax=Urbifossiella limnaea TaxID=2528023 RepID=A0A517XYA3_9BACT|nr:hypothetical protein [Urbifossiella limnaea]QDU22485.1 hypothetical protein ETAA1_44660 [Urbifossiella limnaea]